MTRPANAAPGRRRRRRWIAVLGGACACLVAAVAWAHALSVSHLDIRSGADGTLRLELDLSVRDLALGLPLDADHDERVTWGELRRVRGPLEAMVLHGLELRSRGGACTLRPAGLGTRRYDDGAYATVLLDADCPSGSGLRLRYGLLFDVDPGHRALVTFRGVAGTSTAIASRDAPEVALGDGSGRAHPFVQFLREGVHHILVGYDHLAFLLSLLLPAVLVRDARRWRPAPDLRTASRHVLGIVTAFTVAHSITLSLAALGWVTPASRWVEAGIAASVLLAALNNVRPLVGRGLWRVGFAFGLVHGFGFAGALSELGLPTGARVASLLGFNLGVEAGQLAVVALVLPGLYLLRRRTWYARIAMPLASLAIAALAGYWLLSRLGGP